MKIGLAAGGWCACCACSSNVVARVLGKRESQNKIIVLGFDGMDPRLAAEFMKQGKLPALAKLANEGAFRPLRTSLPPQSPVAWSNFITGMNPGGHAIFDFVHRNPQDYMPILSTSSVKGGGKTIKLWGYEFPLSGGEVSLLRKGDAFWQILERHNIPATIYKIPANFPPAPTKQRTLSGMGTPDLLGTYGIFSYYTTEPFGTSADIEGGKVYQVNVVGDRVEARLGGPVNSFKQGSPDSFVDFTAYVDPTNPVVKIRIEDNEFILKQGEWSDWKRVTFHMIPTQSVDGICKFFLKEAHPELKLYVSPVNIDPARAALPISTPTSYSRDLDAKFGSFYTKGLPADTHALDHGVFTDEDFLVQDNDVLDEERPVFDYELNRFDSGLLFYYFSCTDQRQHMFWRCIDKGHPAYDPTDAARHGGAIEDIYVAMDNFVSKAMKKADKNTLVMVMSDHGFTPFRRAFNLNTWLADNGYMKLISEKNRDADLFQNTEWLGTRAYALGLNGLYINVKGREGKGIVTPGTDRENLIHEIARKLEEVTDPATGAKIINRAYPATELYRGPYVDEAPDLLVGYAAGYRTSWASPLGKTPVGHFEDNKAKWSGDHCTDPEVTPGVLFTNAKVNADFPSLCDLTASILHVFGIEKPAAMVGQNVVQWPV